jgi:hypothetical protein
MQLALKSKTIDSGRAARLLTARRHLGDKIRVYRRVHTKEPDYAFCATILAPGFGCQKIVKNSLL